MQLALLGRCVTRDGHGVVGLELVGQLRDHVLVVREHDDLALGLEQVGDKLSGRVDLTKARLLHDLGQAFKGEQRVWVGHQGVGVEVTLAPVDRQVEGDQ